jgi:hypothetical protein
MKVIQISEEELDRLRDELLTTLERDNLKNQEGTFGKPLSFDAVNYHIHIFVNAIKKA